MINHFELLESKRKHIVHYSQDKIPEKKLVEDALYKAWKTQPSKNNMMAYFVDVYGPDKKLYKEYIWKLCNQNHIKTDKEYNAKGYSNVTHNARTHPNPNYEHVRSSAYLFVFSQRLVKKANPFYELAIEQGEHVADEMIPERFGSLTAHVSIEVGIFAANLTNYLLSSGLDMSYNLCFSKDLQKWHDYGFTYMQKAPVLMMSTGYGKETRRDRLNKNKHFRDLKMKLKKNPDTKPNLEEIIKWRSNEKLN
jgi:hypothetical protein|tara:strand:+ start:440 stop:1192 length:753 start_codon:yes stop_codon:yes gene_type:complete